MESNLEIREIMKLLHPLSVSSKLEIISRLTRELRSYLPAEKENKDKLLDELFGSWEDVGENIIEDILGSRTISDKEFNFDKVIWNIY